MKETAWSFANAIVARIPAARQQKADWLEHINAKIQAAVKEALLEINQAGELILRLTNQTR